MGYTFDVFRGSETGRVVKDKVTRPLNSNEVLLDITHASLCGTDDLYVNCSQVLGHEGIGIVKEVGSNVQSAMVGDRVGINYVQKVCGQCQNCLSGKFQVRNF
jgi:D-arabinose 1-dehydrogenase-like Zn-dependent alcohol dehydrogenase